MSSKKTMISILIVLGTVLLAWVLSYVIGFIKEVGVAYGIVGALIVIAGVVIMFKLGRES